MISVLLIKGNYQDCRLQEKNKQTNNYRLFVLSTIDHPFSLTRREDMYMKGGVGFLSMPN